MEKRIKKVSKFANNQFDFILCITVLLLLALGLVMVLSASSPSSLADYGNSYHYFEKTGTICYTWNYSNVNPIKNRL